jgi:hypothetical protein
LLYIAGYGRSGSTILDIALSAHPRIEGFGELAYVHRELADDPAGLGPFWSGFPTDRTRSAGTTAGPADHAEAARIVDGAERLLPARALRPGSPLRRRYLSLQRTVLGELVERTGAEVLVDSSKSSWLRTWRLPLLGRVAADVHCVVLVRDLGGVVRSVRSGRGDTLATQRLPTTRAIIGWTLATTAAAATGLATCGPSRTRLVRYEDLAARPRPTLDGIVAWLGLDPDPGIARGVTDGFRPRHQVNGNRVRTRPLVHIDDPSAPAPPPRGLAGLASRGATWLVDRSALRRVPRLLPVCDPAGPQATSPPMGPLSEAS